VSKILKSLRSTLYINVMYAVLRVTRGGFGGGFLPRPCASSIRRRRRRRVTRTRTYIKYFFFSLFHSSDRRQFDRNIGVYYFFSTQYTQIHLYRYPAMDTQEVLWSHIMRARTTTIIFHRLANRAG